MSSLCALLPPFFIFELIRTNIIIEAYVSGVYESLSGVQLIMLSRFFALCDFTSLNLCAVGVEKEKKSLELNARFQYQFSGVFLPHVCAYLTDLELECNL